MTLPHLPLPLVAGVIVLAGLVGIDRPIEQTIAVRSDELRDELRRCDEQRAVVARTSDLERERRRLGAILAPYRLHVDRPTAVGRFLDSLAASAERNGVRLTAITADVRQTVGARRALPRPTLSPIPGPATSGRPASEDVRVLDEAPLTISLEGRYAALISTLRQLSRKPLAARLAISSLSAHPNPGDAATIVAAIVRVAVARDPDDAAPRPSAF